MDARLREASKSEIDSRTLKSSSTMITNSDFCVIPGFGPQRQRERKYGSQRLIITHAKHSTVSLNNGAADGKANAEAIWLGAVKRLEYFLWMRQTNAMVADVDDNASLRTLRPHNQALGLAVRKLRRFCSVANKIHQYLLNLDSVGKHRRQGLRQFQVKGDPPPIELVLG